MRTINVNLYSFSELSQAAQQSAIQRRLVDQCIDWDWSERVIDYLKETLKLLGWSVDKVRYSGFYSQGDGASFLGTWEPQDVAPEIPQHLADDRTLLDLHAYFKEVQLLLLLAKQEFKISSKESNSRYCHSGCVWFETASEAGLPEGMDQEEFVSKSRRLMDWCYYQIQNEYEYLTSEKKAEEDLLDSDLEFTKDGNIYTE